MIVRVLEEAPPAAHDDRVDYEPELVDQVVAQQRLDEGAAAGDRDVLTRLPLELLYLLYDVLIDEYRVLPLQRAL